jgi:hypothetical protein
MHAYVPHLRAIDTAPRSVTSIEPSSSRAAWLAEYTEAPVRKRRNAPSEALLVAAITQHVPAQQCCDQLLAIARSARAHSLSAERAGPASLTIA